jgi:hypothetical protein
VVFAALKSPLSSFSESNNEMACFSPIKSVFPAGRGAQAAEYFPSKCEALSSNSSKVSIKCEMVGPG